MDLMQLVETTSSGGVAAFTTSGPGAVVKRKPVEKGEGAGMKPDALVKFISGWKKKR